MGELAEISRMDGKFRTYCDIDSLTQSPLLSDEARMLIQMEKATSIFVAKDTSLRCKVGDPCGLTCTFCHNEGTPVIVQQRARGRVSVYESTNGVNFMPGVMEPTANFTEMLSAMKTMLDTNEVHWTGGEPTLNTKLDALTSIASSMGLVVKATSNGETGIRPLAKLRQAGLEGINFSIFGTTPSELAQTQGPLYANTRFAQRHIDKQDEAIREAVSLGMSVSVNVVMTDASHESRILRLLEKFSGLSIQIRILDDLGVGFSSGISIYNMLARLGAHPVRRKVTAGASGAIVYFELPDGQEIGFKQIRDARLPSICEHCGFNNETDCREGYYGVRVYVNDKGEYQVGVCIQRMDLTLPIGEFFQGGLPQAILNLRDSEYRQLVGQEA